MPEKPYILCVDDEENILKSLKRVLKNDFEVLTASNANDGIKLFNENQNKIMVIISDLKIPGKNVIEFIKEVESYNQGTVFIILSGSTQNDIKKTTETISEKLVFRYLDKPWDKKQLIEAVKDGIRAFRGER